jgi:hypothetical protein
LEGQVKLLEIQSSPRGESYDSITLTKSFIEACGSGNDSIVVDTYHTYPHGESYQQALDRMSGAIVIDGIASNRNACVSTRRSSYER